MRQISMPARRGSTPSLQQNSLYRILKYTLFRALALFAAITAAVYLTILIANFGGHIDRFLKADIDFALGMSTRGRDVTFEEFEQMKQAAYEAAGLNTPFAIRSFYALRRGLTLDFGNIDLNAAGRPSRTGDGMPIRDVIFDALPRSLLIFGTANLLLFLTTVFVALPLVNKQHGWFDKLITMLTPLSSVPAWVYGVVLNLIVLRTFGSILLRDPLNSWPDELNTAFLVKFLRHLALPLLCIFLSGLFRGIYTWRMYFQLHVSEDYVELAKAKGLHPRFLERHYILRPMLPSLITSFTLLFVELWQQVIILERVFEVAGIGRLFGTVINYRAAHRTPLIVAMVVTFAYLLGGTVFLLDIVYAIVDPRIKVGNQSPIVKASASRRRSWRQRFKQTWRRPVYASPKAGPAFAGWGDAVAVSAGAASAGAAAAVTAVPPRSAPTIRGILSSLAARLRFANVKRVWRRRASRVVERLHVAGQRLSSYPAAILGLVIVLGLVGVSVYTMVTIPYSRMLVLWREGEELWLQNPRDAAPAWTNVFRRDKLPVTLIGNTVEPSGARNPVTKRVEVVSEDMREITLSFPFNYPYGRLPQDVGFVIDAQYGAKRPMVIATWIAPDGREMELMNVAMQGRNLLYRVTHDERLRRRWRTEDALAMLFAEPDVAVPAVVKGQYELQLTAFVFEEDADVDAKFIIYGQAFGLSGTDGRRRDLKVPLLWGMALALAFGLSAAAVTTFSSVLIAAVGAWFGGWVDMLVERITEANMILPFLPVAVMVYILYSKSILMILGVTVLLTIFGPAIKTYRTLFLQVRESPYIEAARAYGATDRRIIFRYLIPRMVTVLIPRLVILVPSYVFLEATLAMLDVSDPVLPTWGKLVIEALSRGLALGNYYLVLQPLALLLLVGFAFALLGISLERALKTEGMMG